MVYLKHVQHIQHIGRIYDSRHPDTPWKVLLIHLWGTDSAATSVETLLGVNKGNV